MNLNTLRHIKLLRGGEIRAWALTRASYWSIFESAPDVISWDNPDDGDEPFIFDIPVVFVEAASTEGVIV